MSSDALNKARRENGKLGGRPKGSVSLATKYAIEFKEQLAKAVHERSHEMIQAQIDAAIGVTAERYNAKTGDLYYVDEGPNPSSFKGLIEHVIGRPKETVALEGPDGGAIKLDVALASSIKKIYGSNS